MGYTIKKQEDFYLIENDGGATLGSSSGKIIEKDGFAFKDLAGTGKLLPYEDWRISAEERAADLASRLSVEEIAGLMLYSAHQMIPFKSQGPFKATYNGEAYNEKINKAHELTDQQKKFLSEDHIRHVLIMKFENTETVAKWNNEIQKHTENLPFGIPVNNSSDPRHSAKKADAEFRTVGKNTSKWPEGIGLAATFSPEICYNFARIASLEYRAMGITTALSPQIDLATEPRWMRFADTFGEESKLATEMARAYCDGMQTTEGSSDGWGEASVITMVKHWPGGGSGESGRDAHYAYGKYAVYPGNNTAEHLLPFTEGAFKLKGATKMAGAVMPYYTISWNYNGEESENVGNSYNKYIIKDMLRDRYGYDGVVCTDWGITGPLAEKVASFTSRCWGVEQLSTAEQHLKIIMSGVDQFGGNNDIIPVLQAYSLGCERYGTEEMRKRFEESAVRLLRGMFRTGLFENPYLDVEKSTSVVGNDDFCEEGYSAQLKSLTLIKNQNAVLPLKRGIKVYIPERFIKSHMGFFANMTEEEHIDPISNEILEGYFERVDSIEEADASIVFIDTPISDSYSEADLAAGGNGYMPISLQYRPYTAENARKVSIAGGDPREKDANRSYFGKTAHTANEQDLDNIINAKKASAKKPVITVVTVNNPVVPAEFEPYSDGILLDFGVQKKAILDVLVGDFNPSGKMPVEFPANMDTVEAQYEDVAFDMEPYTDSEGNTYGFGFGLSYK